MLCLHKREDRKVQGKKECWQQGEQTILVKKRGLSEGTGEDRNGATNHPGGAGRGAGDPRAKKGRGMNGLVKTADRKRSRKTFRTC